MTMNTQTIKSNDGDKEWDFYCPIHPEILKEKPGYCARCGMLLCRVPQDEA
jgi:hypothetical protein